MRMGKMTTGKVTKMTTGKVTKLATTLLAGLLVLIAVPGCGSSDDAETPKQQCEALITQLCGSAISCQVGAGLILASEEAAENADCKSAAAKSLDCSKAVGVSSRYQACMDKAKNPPCDEVNQAIASGTLGLPSECNQVILVVQ